MRRGLGAWLRDERGNALVETALVLPVVLVLALGVVMAGRVVQAKLGVQAAAREAARAMAEATSPWDGRRGAGTLRGTSAATAHGLSPSRFSLYVDNGGFWRGGTVRAAAWYWVRLADLPLLGRYQVDGLEHGDPAHRALPRADGRTTMRRALVWVARDERGQAMVLVALFLPALIAVAGLVTDGGMVFAERRALQNMADAAAAAGAMQINEYTYRASNGWNVVLDPAAARAAATDYLATSAADY